MLLTKAKTVADVLCVERYWLELTLFHLKKFLSRRAKDVKPLFDGIGLSMEIIGSCR